MILGLFLKLKKNGAIYPRTDPEEEVAMIFTSFRYLPLNSTLLGGSSTKRVMM